MLFLEEAARRGLRRTIQIFASDIDATALMRARQGLYPAAIETDVSEERLRRYFTRERDHYRIHREIRDLILFANHSVFRDPPFSRIDLISSRNLLIYLERELQQQVLSTFHYAAKPKGFLFLGASETADSPQGLFRTVDRDARIYQACDSGEKLRELPRISITPRLGHIPVIDIPAPAAQSELNRHMRALEQIAPPSILVNADYRVMNMSDSAGRFLQPSGGALRNDVTELVRAELRFDLRACLLDAIERNEQSVSLPIPVHFNGHARRVCVQVRPVSQSGEGRRNALVFFLEGQEIKDKAAELAQEGRGEANSETVRLKEELEQTRASLHASRENFETTNEERRASNEELQSLNEEYRSSAEELETGKEELQSVNEELETVNAELKVRLDSVSRSNNDLQNLMAATSVGTLFLDNGLRIKRFTPSVADLFNIAVVDEGRPITDFTNRLDYPAFAEDARSVLKNLGSMQREVKSNGRWYLTRLHPYRTEDNRIEGVVCTFVDISERKQAETALKAGEAHLKDTLAAVQAMAEHPFGEEVKHPEVLQRFSKRIQALSIAHELLAASNWTGASLSELARRQLAPFIGGRKEQLQLAGPDVTLPPGVATRLGLVLHELGTRALKYGALSTPEGRVRLEWQVSSDGGQQQLNIAWQENGGPKPAELPKGGLETLPIEQGLAAGKVELRLKSSGLECSITMPLATETTQKA